MWCTALPRLDERCLSAAIFAVAVAAGAVLPRSPLPVAGALTVGCLAITAALFARRLPQMFLGLLGALLLGYAFLGRGFAYLGSQPIYIGEIALAFGVFAATVSGAIRWAFRSPLVWLLVVFDLWSAGRTIPYLGSYDTVALRDAVVWIYSIFAILVVACLLYCGRLRQVLEKFQSWLPFFLISVPVLWWISRFAYDAMPRAPGSEVPIPSFKPGDAAVHLAGIAAYLMVGLYKTPHGRRVSLHPSEWMVWSVWLVAAMLVAALTRGGLLAILAALLLVLALRPAAAGRKLLLVATTSALTAAFLLSSRGGDKPLVSGAEGDRAISLQQVSANLRSVLASGQEENLEGSRRWRLDWWSTILGYTAFGDRFWAGKGFGINLADEDGFQTDGSLRSPHNAHLNILAREGVPGATLWVLLQGTFAFAMARAYVRAQRSGRISWARVDLWVLAYWLASLTNMAFDVVLEGPQGGIWFWSLFGFGIAVLELQQEDSAGWGREVHGGRPGGRSWSSTRGYQQSGREERVFA